MEELFAIGYKLKYSETSDWGVEYLKAKNQEQALNIFAKMKEISTAEFKSFENWEWEEGVWSAEFWNIKKVKEVSCPHCNGTGIIHI